MPTGVQETTDIPKDKVDQVIAGYRLDSPLKIEKFEQPNHLWTVRATFADSDE